VAIGWGQPPRSPVQCHELLPTPIWVKFGLVSSCQWPGLPLNMLNAVWALAPAEFTFFVACF